MVDWGAGQYEQTAAELEPVSERIIAAVAIEPSEQLLDIACGTGNAALLAAQAGAQAMGIDSAPRLVEVAAGRATALGLSTATFLVGDAQELPVADASFDAVVSVFGIIFAADPERALSEAMRVLRPGGRALLTAWIPAGAIDEVVGIIGRAVAAATGSTRGERFRWHDRDAVSELAGRVGAVPAFEDAQLTITAPSPDDYVERQREHPMQLRARAVLEPAGTYAEVTERIAATLRGHNEDPAAFRVTSPYRIIRLHHAAG